MWAICQIVITGAHESLHSTHSTRELLVMVLYHAFPMFLHDEKAAQDLNK